MDAMVLDIAFVRYIIYYWLLRGEVLSWRLSMVIEDKTIV